MVGHKPIPSRGLAGTLVSNGSSPEFSLSFNANTLPPQDRLLAAHQGIPRFQAWGALLQGAALPWEMGAPSCVTLDKSLPLSES